MINPPADVGNIPPGRFWTASAEHARCGGVLPRNCIRPLTPEIVHNCIKTQQRGAREPSKALEQQPSLEKSVALLWGSTALQESSLSVKHARSAEGGTPGGSSARSSMSLNDENRKRNQRAILSIGAVQEDVLLAFELFRSWYWRTDHPVTHRNQRDTDIEAILGESDREASAWSYPCTQHVKSLRNFFATIWPGLTNSHFKQMQKWIENSKTVETFEVPVILENPMRQAETLRELIELFDAIDSSGSGLVP
eukprot:CAMPEP_0169093386 /NCGR_PEP_ID=MMETSP1015-20121227/17408_1 /TAXON_ID=342587 /ORGANISM="Karlodinium micrum, Strain CCMP2283" /LENGTH=251 /DNA_ID=CAMNT_0009154021 /DNA_START=1 /DNA_END=752 /DNA_ORIENTATION=+